MVSSESAAFACSNYELERDLQPGEAIFITFNGDLFSEICCEETALTPCLFEFVYFARPDSVIDGISVYQARQAMGTKLAEKIKKHIADDDIDVVIPIPESSITSGVKVAEVLNKEIAISLLRTSATLTPLVMELSGIGMTTSISSSAMCFLIFSASFVPIACRA